MATVEFPSRAGAYVPTGRDEVRFRHVEKVIERCVGPKGRCAYDSVVVVGGHGITSHTFAARLARSPEFAGNVVLAGPPAAEDRRLKAGVSMRGAAADYAAYALNVPTADLVRACTGPDAPVPAANRQTAAMAYQDRGGNWRFSRPGTWQGGRRGLDRPGVYGFRNSRMAAAIKELSARAAVIEKPEPVESLDHARSLATGRRPLVVNTTTNAGLLGNEAPKPHHAIIAAQMPLKAAPGGIRFPLEEATAFAPLIYREGTIDVGYFTPFADPLSPDATFYGIMARAVRLAQPVDKQRQLDVLTGEIEALAEVMGAEPVDPEETTGRAFVPAPPPRGPRTSAPGTLELRRIATPFISAYYADGITGGTLGGLLAAEAVLRGSDPYRAAARALARYRKWNYVWYLETVHIPAVADRLMRVNVRVAMFWPHTTALNYWFSRA